jgi:hypothetical protein
MRFILLEDIEYFEFLVDGDVFAFGDEFFEVGEQQESLILSRNLLAIEITYTSL